MFHNCSSLKELNLNNFNTNNVTNMSFMFYGCSSLKELNLNNFNTDNVTNMSYMFIGCLDELKLKINFQFKNFKEEAFKIYLKIFSYSFLIELSIQIKEIPEDNPSNI